MNKIKTRFAPSPTGYLHIGNIKIALYSWLFAKKNNGIFIIRIENTNNYKLNNYYSNQIIDIMNWLNLTSDIDIIYQNERIKRYDEIANLMLNSNLIYYCFCSKTRLYNLRKKQIKNNEKPKYDEYCKKLDKFKINKYLKKNKKYVIRFKNSKSKYTHFYDLIYKNIKFKNSELDDLVIKRSDNTYTYNFCSSIDDNDLNITHIIRGNDHINNTPRQINILKSINFNIPKYIHIPIILDSDKKKISKKNNKFSIYKFRKEGILPESIIHFLMNFKENNKIFSLNEIINNFNINDIKKSNIIFDYNKLYYINKLYLSKLPIEKVEEHFSNYIKKFNIKIIFKYNLKEILTIFKNRFNTFSNLLFNIKILFFNKNIINKNLLLNNLDNYLLNLIKNIYNKIIKIKYWEFNNIKIVINNLISKENSIYKKNFYYIMRIITTGIDKTPELHYIIYLLGKRKLTNRIKKYLNIT